MGPYFVMLSVLLGPAAGVVVVFLHFAADAPEDSHANVKIAAREKALMMTKRYIVMIYGKMVTSGNNNTYLQRQM